MKTKEEIKNAISILKENKNVCIPVNFWGDNNIKKLDVCIHVLENELSEEEINKKYPCPSEGMGLSLWNSAMASRSFLDDEVPIEYLLYPVKDKYTVM